jgi:hypothetical protein
VLTSGQSDYFQISEEYADLVRFPQEAHASLLIELLRQKYAQQPPDLILASHNEASQFLLDHGAELFPGVPLVVSGEERTAHRRPSLPSHATSVIIAEDISGTIDLALSLLPDLRHIFVVAGGSLTSHLQVEEAHRHLHGKDARLEYTYLTGLTDLTCWRRYPGFPPIP